MDSKSSPTTILDPARRFADVVLNVNGNAERLNTYRTRKQPAQDPNRSTIRTPKRLHSPSGEVVTKKEREGIAPFTLYCRTYVPPRSFGNETQLKSKTASPMFVAVSPLTFALSGALST